MDEKRDMNYSEYIAIFSGNSELLEKAKLGKIITALENERKAFNSSKSSSIYKFEDITSTVDSNNEMVARITKDEQMIDSKQR